jgi:Mg-chelatase subunit ChlI
MPQSEADIPPQQDAVVPAGPAAAADSVAAREREREPLYTAAAIPTEAAKRAAHAAGRAVVESSRAAAEMHQAARNACSANGNPTGGAGGTEGESSRAEEPAGSDMPHRETAAPIGTGPDGAHAEEEHPAEKAEGGNHEPQGSRETKSAPDLPAKKTPSPSRTEPHEPPAAAAEEASPSHLPQDVPNSAASSPRQGANGGSKSPNETGVGANTSAGTTTAPSRSIRGLRVVAVSIRKYLVPRQPDT